MKKKKEKKKRKNRARKQISTYLKVLSSVYEVLYLTIKDLQTESVTKNEASVHLIYPETARKINYYYSNNKEASQ